MPHLLSAFRKSYLDADLFDIPKIVEDRITLFMQSEKHDGKFYKHKLRSKSFSLSPDCDEAGYVIMVVVVLVVVVVATIV